MILTTRRSLSVAAIGALLSAPIFVAPAATAADPIDITLVDINDFHGRIDSNTTKFATTVEQIRQSAGEENTLFLSVGDNIGASPFASATQQDAPTIDVLNALDLAASAVGNHEFDRGFDDLTGRVTDRADFAYLGANVVNKADGSPALPASETFTVGGIKLAVIGAVTEETPTLVTPSGITTIDFTDPVAAVNDEVERLEALPEGDQPDVIVASYHEGAGAGAPDGSNLAEEVSHGGAFADIVNNTDASVDAIFTGHTHKAYAWDAPVPGGGGSTRPILQTGSYGENVGKVTLSVDPDTNEISAYTVQNVARVATADLALPRVAEVKTIVDSALAYAATIGNEKVADITTDITTAYSGGSYVDGVYTGSDPANPKTGRDDRASESTIGNLVPDAMLAQSKVTNAPADLALNNPGGLRDELLFAGNTTTGGPNNTDGSVTFAEANAVLPFTNNLYTVSLTGASLKKVLEQQWQRDGNGNVPSRPYQQLGLSKNARYTFDATRAEGDRVTSVWIDDELLDSERTYRVIVPSFLGTGGDNFRAFTEGTWVDTGVVDYEGFIDYLGTNSPVAPDFGRRSVAVTGIADSYDVGDTVSFSLPKLNLTSIGSPADTSVSATLETDSGSIDLGSQPVTNGASGTFAFDLPASAGSGATISVEAQPSGTIATIPLVVAAPVESTTTATAPAQVTKGETFDIAVTVAAAEGKTATGTVTVSDGSTEVGRGQLADGAATVMIDAADLRLGQRTLTVEYTGSGPVAPSVGSVTIDVIKGETTFSATGSTTPYGTGATIALTAAPGTTGIVYVANQLGMTAGTAFLIDGKGTFRFGGTALRPGSHTFGLFFNGSASYEPADASVTVKVVKAATKTRATVTKKIKVGQRGRLTARVSAKGFTPHGGTVVVKRGSRVVGKSTVRHGVARVKLAQLKRGKHTLTVTYSGNGLANESKTAVRTTVVKKR